MHISEGVLSLPVLVTGGAFSAGGIIIGLRSLEPQKIIIAGTLAAVFFVASLIHVPIGVASAHLLMTGLMGVILGWAAMPAIFVALILQAVLFQYGGLTTLGANTFSMGFAAVLSWYVFRIINYFIPGRLGLKISSFCGGMSGVAFAALFTALSLSFTAEGFKAAAIALFMANLPIMLAEGLITMFCVEYLVRYKPGFFSFSMQHN